MKYVSFQSKLTSTAVPRRDLRRTASSDWKLNVSVQERCKRPYHLGISRPSCSVTLPAIRISVFPHLDLA